MFSIVWKRAQVAASMCSSSSSILIRYNLQEHDTTHAGQGHRAQMQQLQHQVEQLTRGLLYKEEQAHHQAQQIAKLSGSSCE
jgi:hypothetical protein